MVSDLFDFHDGDDSVLLRVHVQPGAGKTAVVGRHGDALKVRVAAPPEKNRANEACVELLARILNVPAATVELSAGGSSRTKRFRIAGVDLTEFTKHLELALTEAGVPPGGNAPGHSGVPRSPSH